jgi:hypothetical protein
MTPTWILLAAGAALLAIGRQAPLRLAAVKIVELLNARRARLAVPVTPVDVASSPEKSPDTQSQDRHDLQLQLLRITEFGASRGNAAITEHAFALMKLIAETAHDAPKSSAAPNFSTTNARKTY